MPVPVLVARPVAPTAEKPRRAECWIVVWQRIDDAMPVTSNGFKSEQEAHKEADRLAGAGHRHGFAVVHIPGE